MSTSPKRSDDADDLASFGYAQELVRTFGAFSTFATGFAFISILTGMFLLFGFVYSQGGPASIWSWVIALGGQMLFALAFAELSARYPLAGSVYNWPKLVGARTTSWMAGLAMICALTVSTAAVALAFQAILPAISEVFWLYGDGTGKYDASTNAVILGIFALALSTFIFLCGTRVRGIVNNVGVSIELVGVVVMIVLLLVNAERGPGVIFETNGTADGQSLGFVGPLLICLLLGLTVQWGFDTAGSISEETVNPRKTAPKAILRALLASGVLGALLFLAGFMSLKDIASEDIATGGLAFVLQSAVGKTAADVLLAAAAVAVFVCLLANQTGAVNMIFAMSRDNALPGSPRLAKVAKRSRTPVLAPLVVAAVALVILLSLMRQPQILLVTTSVTATLALIAYTLVALSLARARLRGEWAPAEPGYFTLSRLGTPITVAAVVWGATMIVNLAWPRKVFYNPVEPFHWYLQWGGVLIPTFLLTVGFLVYRFVQRHRIGILAAHAAAAPDARERHPASSPRTRESV